MNEISREIFEKYQVRKTYKQKSNFIDFIKKNFEGVKIEEGGILRSRNIIVGDIKNADVIYTAHYDTCAVLPFPNFMPPKNIWAYILYNLLIAAGVILIGCLTLAVYLGLFIIIAIPITAVLIIAIRNPLILLIFPFSFSLLMLLWIATYCLIVSLMIIGPANKHTANDNTSGVITLCEIYSYLSEEERKRAAFVFFDFEEPGLFGSRFFKRLHKEEMEEKLLVNFDCVSDGDNIMIILNEKARDRYGEKVDLIFAEEEEGKTFLIEKASEVIYPSDHLGFPCNICVAAFQKNKLIGLYLSKVHTPKDTAMDEKNIEAISRRIKKLL